MAGGSAGQMFGQVPFVGGMLGMGFQAMADAENQADLEEQRQRFESLALARFNPGEYRAQQITPEAYAAPDAAQYQLAKIDPRMREAQMAALQSLRDQATGVADAQQNAARYAAMGDASRLAAGREAAIMQNAQARGVGGGGMEFALRAQAAQDAANRAQAGTMEAARMAALQKLQGTQAYMGGLGALRGQDFDQEAHNADVINAFNRYNTEARNRAAMANVDLRNQAAMTNASAVDAANRYNLDRGDRNAQTDYQNRMQKEQARAGQNTAGVQYSQQANDEMAQRAAAERSKWESMAGMGMGGGMSGMMGGASGGTMPSGMWQGEDGPMRVRYR